MRMPVVRWWRAVVATIGFGGGLAFAAAFAWSYVDPLWVERMARDAITVEVQSRVDGQLERFDISGSRLDVAALSAIAQRLAGEERARVATIRQQLRDGLAERVTARVAEMLKADCTCRRRIAADVDAHFAALIARGEAVAARLDDVIRSKYQDVAASLVREFRIFTATNACVLLLLGAAVVLKRRAGVHLLPAALLVLVASAGVSHAYLFQQDWLHTIVFADYMGLGFVAYVGIAALFLFDIVFNKARVTCELINALLNVVGAAASAIPC